MGFFNRKIIFKKRIGTTFILVIVNFSTQECYEIYLNFSLTDPWWFPRYDPEFGKYKIPLYGWLFFYFGRKTEGVVVLAGPGEKTIAEKPIYDRKGRLWRMYVFSDKQMAKDFRQRVKKFKTTVTVEKIDGEYKIVNRIGRHKIFGI